MSNSVPKLVLGIALAALALGAGLFYWQEQSGATSGDLQVATVLDAPRPLPEFSLIDQDERPFVRADMQGRWHLLFFGFTHCPDICPNTLGQLAAVQRQLADERLRIVFVSVDPGRDTPTKLRGYVRYFNPEFVGVTGTTQAIDGLTSALHVPYLLREPDAQGHYQVEHSAALVLTTPDSKVAAYLSPPFTTEQLVQDLRVLLGKG